MRLVRRFGVAMLVVAVLGSMSPAVHPIDAARGVADPLPAPGGPRVPDPVTFVPESGAARRAQRPEATIGFANGSPLVPKLLNRTRTGAAPAAESPSGTTTNPAPAPNPTPTSDTAQTPTTVPIATPTAAPSVPQGRPLRLPADAAPAGGSTGDAQLQADEGSPRVTGTISAVGNGPLAGMIVCADASAGYPYCIASATTAGDGSYAMATPAGTYNVRVYDPNWIYVAGYYSVGGFRMLQAQADVITVSATDVIGIDITMPLFPYVRGTLSDTNGDPVPGVTIAGTWFSDITAADGTFAVKTWPDRATTLLVQATSQIVGGWYTPTGLVQDQLQATAISTGATDVTGIDIVDPFWPTISGRVTDPQGAPIESLTVTFNRGTYQTVSTTTAADGTYKVYARNGGPWTSMFAPYPSPWIWQWVSVDAGSDVTLDVTLHAYPVVAGLVTGPTGDPLSGIQVDLQATDYRDTPPSVQTDGQGHFSFTYRASSPVRLVFSDATGTYVQGFLGASGFVYDDAEARQLSPVPDTVVDGSVTMPAHVYLTGHVQLPDGTGVSGGTIWAYRPAGVAGSATLGDDGAFSIKLPPRAYSLSIAGGWYGEQGFAYSSGAVAPLAVGQAGRDVDVVLPPGYAIRGRVTAGTTPLANIEVDVFLDGSPFTSGTTASDGTYSIAVPPGAYLVGFYDPSRKHAHGWLGPAGYTSDPQAGRLVSVGTADATDINASLPAMRHIAGKVVDYAYGSTVPYAYVEAFLNGVYYSSQYATANGAFNLAVGPGKVTLWMYDGNLRQAPGWRASTGLTTSFTSAAVTTISTADVSGITIRTPEAALMTLSTGWSPAPGSWSGVDATVEAVANGASASFSLTDSSGNRFMPLLQGSYRLWVDVNSQHSSLADGWYMNGTLTADEAQATVKTAATNGQYSIGITVPTGLLLAGSLGNARGFLGGDTDVLLYANGSFYLDSLARSGYFSVNVLPGTYRIAFIDPYGLQAAGWLGEDGFVPDYASARDVAVTASSVTLPVTHIPMDTPPAAPTGVVVNPYHASAHVAWTASATTATRPIIHYAVTAAPGGRQCIAMTTTSCTVTGLNDGTPYTFTVTASSMVGPSVPSIPSGAITPLPVPDAPASITVTPDGATVGLSWAPAADNGSAVTSYLATASPGGQSCSGSPSTATACTITGLADGRYTVTVYAANANGRGPGRTASATVDTVAPVVGPPVVSLRSGLSMTGTAVPVSVAWTAADVLTGVVDTSLELQTGAGSFVDQVLATPTSTSQVRTLGSSSSAYRFRDRAEDGGGNVSGWATGPATFIGQRAETGTGIAYHGTWGTATTTSALGGRLRYTSTRSAYVTYTFTGRGFAFISRKGATSGTVAVYLDGKFLGNVSLYSPTTTVRWVAYAKTYSTSTKHVIKIVNLATSGHPRFYIDGFTTIR